MIPHFRFCFEAGGPFSPVLFPPYFLPARQFPILCQALRFFFFSVERFFALCRYSIFFDCMETQKSFFSSLSRTKNIYKTLYNNGGALYNVPTVDKWISVEIRTERTERANSLVNWSNIRAPSQKVFELS